MAALDFNHIVRYIINTDAPTLPGSALLFFIKGEQNFAADKVLNNPGRDP